MGITYTFATDCGIKELAGETVTGGKFDEMVIAGKKEIIIRFATRIAGKGVIAKIAGKPELEALYAKQCAKQARSAAILEQLGWPIYRKIQTAASNARAAYDAASEHGYPMREAAAARKADEALQQARIEYPGAAAYAVAESYSFASSDLKAAAGRKAVEAIEQGADPLATIEAMQTAWSEAAAKAVANA